MSMEAGEHPGGQARTHPAAEGTRATFTSQGDTCQLSREQEFPRSLPKPNLKKKCSVLLLESKFINPKNNQDKLKK